MTDVSDTIGAETTVEPEAAAPAFNEIDYDQVPAEEWDAETAKRWRAHYAAEHKKYREAWSPFEKVFSQFSEQDRELLLRVLGDLPSNPQQSLAFFVENAKQLFGEEFLRQFISESEAKVSQETPEPVKEPSPSALTPDDIRAMLDDNIRTVIREEITKVEEKQRIVQELRDLGLKEGTEEADVVCFLAGTRFGGDLRKAYEHVLSRLGQTQQQGESQTAPAAPDGVPASPSLEGLSRKEKVKLLADQMFG